MAPAPVRLEIRSVRRRVLFAGNYLPIVIAAVFVSLFGLMAVGSTSLWIMLATVAASGVLVTRLLSGRPYVVIGNGLVEGRNLVRSFSVELKDVREVRWHSLWLGKGDYCPSLRVEGRRRRLPILALFLWDPAEAERVLRNVREGA